MQIRQEEKLLNSNRHYSLRKLSVGLASVLIGISFLNGTKTTVKADTIANKNDEYAKAHEHNESSESMQAALLKNTGVAEGDSVQTGEASKAGNLEVAGNSKDLSAFSMPFNGKNDGNETAKADTTSDQTTQTSDAQTMATQNEKQQASSAQNSAAELQKDLLANTGNNQAEANNQENRLTDQINYKLANQDGTDNKKDSGQNLTVPEATKQVPTTKSDAEKSIAGSSSTQQVNNPSSNHAEDSSQIQNSLKFAKKVLAVNLIETNSSPTTNGGFDEATWGKLDVNNWQGSAQDGVYELTGYTGDLNHIIVPNKADFEQAGKSTNGLQVGITRDIVTSLISNNAQTIAFSKTNNQKIKAIGTDWSYAFSGDNVSLSKFDGSSLDVSSVTNMRDMFYGNSISDLTSLANWDVSNVTDMSGMFEDNSISNLTPLANWDTSKVTNMSEMFNVNKISDLTPLANWDVSKVTDMSNMFIQNKISDLTPLANWDTSKVTNMSYMFDYNSIRDLTSLAHWNTSGVTDMRYMFCHNSISDLSSLAHWNTSGVTNMNYMFGYNSISDLTPLANWDTSKVTGMFYMFGNNSISDLTSLAHWDTSKVTNMGWMFASNPDLIDLSPIADWHISGTALFYNDTKLNLTNINNTPLMQGFLKTPNALRGAIFITNNADLVKATINQDLPDSTNTAKRTITFNIPHATPETIVQTINYYKAIASVQVDFDFYSHEIVQTYPVKASDWQLDTSKKNDDVIIDGVICFKPVKIPYVNGYRPYIIKDPVNPTALLVSFFALPRQSQKTQSTSNEPQSVQSSQKNTQAKHKQSEPAEQEQKDKQVDQGIDYISDTLMHNSSSNADSLEPAQGDSTSIDNSFDSTQNGDAAKNQKVNTAKHKKHIVKKRAIKRRRKHTKKYRLKRRSRKHTKHSRKHTKRSRHAKKRIIKHRKSVSRKFRKFHLKHIKKA